MWNLLTTFLANPNIQSFLISCGASVSWDATKKILNKAEKDDSFALQVYKVIKETFESFYLEYGLEFEEDIVMKAFLESISEIREFSNSDITKKMICDTIGLDIDDDALKKWINIFIDKCSNPKYQWVYNKLSLSSIILPEKSKHKEWMQKYMKDNFCKIKCDISDELPPIFNDIITKLPIRCWYDTRVLIWEILFNAQEHGQAKECMLHINENSITIIDDGIQFNPITMEEQSTQQNESFSQQGGSYALKDYIHNYPEVSLKSEYSKKYNHFTIDFGDSVFDINGMSEIIIPRLGFSRVIQLEQKHPNGQFKYYYIDIDEIPRNRDELLVTYSDVFSLFNVLKRKFVPFTDNDTIFIYFSDLTRPDYHIAFNEMATMLRNSNTPGIKIALLTDTNIYYPENT